MMARDTAEVPYGYVRRMYLVPAIPGRRVRFTETDRGGQSTLGTIARRRSYDNRVYVLFDGERHPMPCHPTSLDYSPAEPATPSAAQEE